MFSPQQQGKYRPIVDDAWELHAKEEGFGIKDKDARESWYKRELSGAIGLSSTRTADKGFDFDLAIAHFEGLADNGFYWRSKLRQSILDRIRYLSGWNDVSAEYCEGILKQRDGLDYLPKLEQKQKADFLFIIRSLKTARRRAGK